MSNAIYPTLPGLAWPVKRTPTWNTRVQKTASGRELRASLYSYPQYAYELQYEFLRSDAYAEFQQLVGFYNSVGGAYDTFLFLDPTDNAVSMQSFAYGDGVSTQFQLARKFGGYIEPVRDFVSPPAVYKTTWNGNDLQYQTARTNLALYSQQIDNGAAWISARSSVTANAAIAPDGTVSADKLVEDSTATSTHYRYQYYNFVGGLTYTKSFYFKQAGRTQAFISFSSSGFPTNANAYFDLSAGTVLSVGTGATGASITPTANGFYRCSVTAVCNSTGNYSILFAPAVGGSYIYNGDGASGVYVWQAQLETGSAATPPIVTVNATVTVTDYTQGSNGLITFSSPPASGTPLLWNGQFYYRCRFLEDTIEMTNFMNMLWSCGKVRFITVKP